MSLRFPRRLRQDRERFAETARIVLFYSAFFVCPFRRVFPYGLSVVSLPIGEPLSDNSFHRSRGALHVIYAKPNAVAIAEIELRQIAVQVLFLAVLINALHAALKDREVAFDRVGMHDATNVFVGRVSDGLVLPIFVAKLGVAGRFVAHDERFLGDIGLDNWKQLLAAHAFN